MSVSIYKSGELNPIAGSGIKNTFTGTTAQVSAAIQSGKITDGTVVYIIDDLDEITAAEIKYNNTTSHIAANTVQGAIDEVNNDLTAKSTLKLFSDSAKEIKFGIDENGDYGYYKDGADSVTPFKKLTSGMAIVFQRVNNVPTAQITNPNTKTLNNTGELTSAGTSISGNGYICAWTAPSNEFSISTSIAGKYLCYSTSSGFVEKTVTSGTVKLISAPLTLSVTDSIMWAMRLT